MAETRTRRWRHLVRIAVVAAVTLFAAVGVAVQPAAAEADDIPAAPTVHNRWYNGCSSPFGDAPGGHNFRDACNWHDLCYGGQIEGYNKAGCDRTFHEFMDTICYYNYGNSGGCRAWSAAYYAGVGIFGGSYYEGPYYRDPYYP